MVNFFEKKMKLYRLEKNYSAEKLAELLNVSRTTLWKWETGKKIPKEAEIRMLSKILNVGVEQLSNLPAEKTKSKIDFSEVVESWLTLFDFDSQVEMQSRMSNALKTISTLNNELTKASFIIKSLLMSIDTMFYVRDKSLNYITANSAFLKNSRLESSYKVFGSTDIDFYNIEEAKVNYKEDQVVLMGGKKISKEGFIPGSKKKKWGLITKTPTFDTKGAVSGIIGTFVDLTEKKKQEKIRELIEINLNFMSAGFSMFDISSGKYLYLNKQREKIFGYSNEEVYKGGLDFLLNSSVHPDFKEKMKKRKLSKVFSGTVEYKIVLPDGTEKWVEDYESRIVYFNKICGISVIKDITEKYKLCNEVSKIPRDLKECIDFHGHFCPGLCYGYIVAKEAARLLNFKRSEDEEVVVISENDSCAVDAFQVLLGATAGKGNLLINNYGKNVYTVYLRDSKKALRFKKKMEYMYNGENPDEFEMLERKIIDGSATDKEKLRQKELKSLDLISGNFNDVFSVEQVVIPEPDYAELTMSIPCDECGEFTMQTKLLSSDDGRKICIPCNDKKNNR
jgi:formylmethanofuran dehydrogenase subunit E